MSFTFGRSTRRKLLLASAVAAIATMTSTPSLAQGSAKATVPSTPLQIYATPTPQGDILRYVQKLADEDGSGLKLKVIEASQGLDYNQLVLKRDLDASLAQHQPYFNSWLRAHPEANDSLAHAATLLVNIFGLYSSKYKSVKDIPDGAKILVPNEQTNLPRALFILQNEGLLKLTHTGSDGSPAALSIDEKSIQANPKKFEFVPTETRLRAKALPDAAASFINGDIALTHGIDPKSALSLESPDKNPYANVLTTRRELLTDPRLKLLVTYLTGPKVAAYINDNYKGFIVPAQQSLLP